MNSATQSAPPWPLTPIPRHNPCILAPNSSPNRAEAPEAEYNIKPDIGEGNVYVQDTWPDLAPVKFEPAVELDPRQAPDETSDDDSLGKKFVAKIAGCRLASASSSAQSVESTKVPPNNLGPTTTPRQHGRPKGAKNRRRDPVVDPEAPLVTVTPRKWAGTHDNMALQ